VPVPDSTLVFAVSISSLTMSGSVSLLAYGSAPGMELIPYFLALLAWVGMAFTAIFLSPIAALVRRLRRGKSAPVTETKNEPVTTPVPESRGDGNNVQA
jgi:hypothetical protein